MKKILLFYLPLIFICSSAIAGRAVFAQIDDGSLGHEIKTFQGQVGDAYSPKSVGFDDPSKKNVLSLYKLILGRFTALLSIFFFIYTIVGGFQWMMAGGNEEKVAAAKGRIRSGIIGVGIVLAAYVITYFVFSQVSQVTGVTTGF